MLSVELQSAKRDQEWMSLKMVCLQSAHHFLVTSMETTGLEPGAVFVTLGSFLCEVSGSTVALGACLEAQGICQCLGASSWGTGSWCPPGSPPDPVSFASSVTPSTRDRSRSFQTSKHRWSNPAGRTSPGDSSLVYLHPSLLTLQVGQMVVAQVTDSVYTSSVTGVNLNPPPAERNKKRNLCYSHCQGTCLQLPAMAVCVRMIPWL